MYCAVIDLFAGQRQTDAERREAEKPLRLQCRRSLDAIVGGRFAATGGESGEGDNGERDGGGFRDGSNY